MDVVRLVFQPQKIRVIPPFPDNVANLKRFWLKTGQGDVEERFFTGDGVNLALPGLAVSMVHGNRGLLERHRRFPESGVELKCSGAHRGDEFSKMLEKTIVEALT